jgi:hypothetical protein
LIHKQNDLEAEIEFHEKEEDISIESTQKLNKKYSELLNQINELKNRIDLMDEDIQNKGDELAEIE